MIYLIRHGQTDWNTARRIQGTTDVPLNAVGQKQALTLLPEIKALKLDRIFVSNLKRARETAEILNREIQVPIIADDRLREISFGKWEGRSVLDLSDSVWHQFYQHPEQIGSEPLINVFQRVKSFFEATDLSRNTLIVTHSGTLRIMAYYWEHPESFDFKTYIPFSRVSFRNTSLLCPDENGRLSYFESEGI
ncbi:MAG: histidine phosphatase family protein [Alphaproteobacteria bacterium]|nr:histidine phosphatase family protein [Alphaproteobacteria bacterium]